MSTWTKIAALLSAGLVPAAAVALAQETPLDLRSSLKIDLPKDSPVTVVSADWGESRASARGGAMLLDLHTSLSLRNSASQRIRGITLLVVAQEVTPGGKASVTVPSLDVAPGDTFPVRIDLRLLRPLAATGAPLVEVALDGVLYDNLGFYGPNKLNSRRTMMVWEMEARRDRKYFQGLLASAGPEGLRREMIASLARQTDRPRLDVQVARGRSTNIDTDRQVQFAFLRFPDSPVDPVAGRASIAGNEARAPRVEVRNRGDRAIRYLELGWILKDAQGREFLAGTVPASLNLAPGQSSQVLEENSLKFSRPQGQTVSIEGMTGFVSSVEFNDGSVWIPSRAALDDPRLRHVLATSPEEQRLAAFYNKKGLAALIAELKKF